MRALTKQIRAPIIAGLLLLTLLLPQATVTAVPVISNVQVSDITASTATIAWTTDVASNSTVYYGTSTPPPPPTTQASVNAPVTEHSVILSNLTLATKYYFYVQSDDSTDNHGGQYYSFITAGYSITLEPACGVCGELIADGVCGEIIGATAIVSAAGTYYITWDTASAANVVASFSVLGAATRSLTFHTPEAKKGAHTVYLTDSAFAVKASAIFTVNPSVKIDIDEGPVGSQVTLYGFGFDASQGIQVKFNGVVVSSSTAPTADSNGSWECPYTIPATPAGHYTFDIGPRSSPNVIVLSKSFTVTPAISIIDANPGDGIYSGSVGQEIEVDGTGFKSKEQGIKVTFDGEPVNINSPVVADENGSWHAPIIVPPLQRGTYAVGASGALTRARDVPTVDLIVGAGILLEPTSAYVGDTIGVKGGGFAPGETGVKVFFGGSVVSSSTITVGNDGTWQSSFTLPASTYGPHQVSASGDITQPAVTNSISVQARTTGLSPNHGAPGDSVSLTGNGFHGTQKLTVTIGGAAASEQPLSQSNGNIVISFHVPDVGGTGEQTLVVTDEGGATASTDFMVETKTLAAPIPVSPVDSTLRSGEVTFEWLTSGSDVTYDLQVSGSESFSSATTHETANLSYTVTNDEDLAPGTYYWRVMATDIYGNESPFSEPLAFTVAPIPTWVWIVVGLVVLVVLMVVAYRHTKFRVSE